MVITEKWDYAHEEAEGGDIWLESFKGDFDADAGNPGHMNVAANRHQNGINCVFYDGHAKRYTPDAIRASKDLTGCTLVQAYPHISSPPDGEDMCDGNNPTCANNLPDNQSPNNICNTFP